MDWDDELCLCFHVTPRKIWNYLRRTRPSRASQLHACGGAGTGCGWCRRYLEGLYEAWGSGPPELPLEQLSRHQLALLKWPGSQRNAELRGAYVRAGGGVPPAGATPPPRGEARPRTRGEEPEHRLD
jgi:bacterioferritin-associated ferredoxin